MPQAASELDLHVAGPGHEAGAPRLAPAAVRLLAVMLEDAPLVQTPPPGLARVTPVKSPQQMFKYPSQSSFRLESILTLLDDYEGL